MRYEYAETGPAASDWTEQQLASGGGTSRKGAYAPHRPEVGIHQKAYHSQLGFKSSRLGVMASWVGFMDPGIFGSGPGGGIGYLPPGGAQDRSHGKTQISSPSPGYRKSLK